MKSLCEINNLIDLGALGKTLKELPPGSHIKAQNQGAYFGAAGNVIDAPNQTGHFMYQVYKQGAAGTMIQATNMTTGNTYAISQHGGTWLPKWTQLNSVDLTNYYTKPQTDHKIAELIRTTRAGVSVDGTLRVRLSGSVLHITNNGHNP